MEKVFLVEDSPAILQRLQELLAGTRQVEIVGQASTAESAISGILHARPDIVFLDLQLEQGSGFDVLRAVHEKAPSIRVYMLSNFASEPYRQAALRLGAQGFFDKSKEFERVREVVAANNDKTIH